ncbi:exopolysaccharide biosynthesis protein [Cognatilysobacter bugurensis]|uniref:Exod protein n=1 Tax=Cognatilysobacter bugurensis TaxID=543356 RepID=A0A918SXG2_9GAMM|nr:exopolysaccharide biosynthesis protein [Lysobacter bugurensis]GHA75807.1 exod protein [Lysobacter bugurensis]
MTPRADDAAHAGHTTRALLDRFSTGPADAVLPLGEVFLGLGRRSFGMLLFVSTLPAFVPIPGVAGAASGPFVVLIGLQLLIGQRQPWLPDFAGRRGPRRATMGRFRDRVSPLLRRLEHVVRPRLSGVLDHRVSSAFTGLQLVALGILLLLPIPLTNYLFAVVLMLFALALIERDGRLMLVAWACGAVVGTGVGVLSGSLASAAARWIEPMF